MIQTLPEKYKIVDATAGPVTTNGGVTGAYISAKTSQMIWLVLNFKQAVGHATTVTLKEATAVAGTSVQTVANSMLIWSNLDTTASDTLVRRTDATSYAVSTAAKPMQVVIGINPAALSDGFDCVGFTVSDSSQATNFVSGNWYLDDRYPQATPPVAITD